MALRNVTKQNKIIVDINTKFQVHGDTIPSLSQEGQFKDPGVPSFTPEGSLRTDPDVKLKSSIEKLTKAPLEPQQRLFALRVIVLPSIYHLLTL